LNKAPTPQLAIGVGTLLAGIAIGLGAIGISSEAGYSGVGPNFLPWVVGSMLALCGLLLLREVFTGGFRNLEEPSGAATGYWAGFAWVSAGILLNAALITRLGFILSCALCFLFAVRGFKAAEGRLDWSVRGVLFDAAIGFAIAAPVYWMFSQLLGINLPGLTSTGWI
jgi:putative tricarboxylic transport membrane protein